MAARPLSILLAVDGSEHSATAVFMACRLVPPGARVLVMSVQTRQMHPSAARGIVEHACSVLNKYGNVPVQMLKSLVVSSDQPKESILREAALHKADIIITGSRGLGRLRQLALGSVSHSLASNPSAHSVLVVHSPLAATNRDRPIRVMLCVDGSDHALAGARALGSLLQKNMIVHIFSAQSPLHSASVVAAGIGGVVRKDDCKEGADEFRKFCTELLREAKREMLQGVPADRTPAPENISGVLAQAHDGKKALLAHIAEQKEPYDLIVCGSRGGGLERFCLGSSMRGAV